MADPVPNTAPAPSGSGGEHSVAHAASLIEGLLGPAPADTPKKPAGAAAEPPAEEPDDAPEESDAATQPAEGDPEADEQTSADESETQPEPDPTPPVEIEVTLPDGSKTKVTAEEAGKGYLRREDHTRKTQALADEKRAFDAQVQQVSQVVKAKLDTLQAELDRLIPSEKSIDWDNLHKTDPAEYVKWKEYFRDLKDQRQAVAHEQAQFAYQEQQRQAQQSAEALKRESEALAKALPVFADPKKGDAARSELRSYLLKAGYTSEQIAGLADHRSVTIAWKAAQYDKLQAAKPAVEKRVVNLPRVQKPGAALDGDQVSRQKLTSLDQKLRKTGRVEDAAALILARMN